MRIFWLVSAAVLTVIPAQADPARDALSEFAKCSSITAVIERLQCYDNAAVAAKMALAAPLAQQQAAVETEEEEESSGGVLNWFGLSESKPVKKAEDFGRPPPQRSDAPKEIQEISSRLAKFSRNARGGAVFTLENGQVWSQIEGDTTNVRDPREGEVLDVTVEKSFFGSYSLTFKQRNGLVKVRRTK
jgi:hypothetical protein